MAGWCSTTQFGYVINAAEALDLKDLDENNSADSDVLEHHIASAAAMIWMVIQGRDDYGSETTMAPQAYTGGSGVFPILEYMNTYLALALLKTGQGMDSSEDMSDGIYNHWVMRMARDVRNGDADVVAT